MPSAALIATDWSPRRQPLATADPRAAVLFRLQRMLAHDERTRPRPPISLPRLQAAALVTEPPPCPPPCPPPRPPVAIATIVSAVAAHFDLQPGDLIQNWRDRRPIAANVAAFLGRGRSTESRWTALEAELGTTVRDGVGRDWSTSGNFNSELARAIAEIEETLAETREGNRD